VQVSHADTHAVIDAAGKIMGQLIDPHLSHRSPFTARRSPQEFLAASTSSVYTVLDAQENVSAKHRDLGGDRAPKRMISSFEALVPDWPDSTRFCRRKEYHLVFCNRVARGAAARSVLGCKQRRPSILGNGPSALQSGERPISHNLAMGCDERVTVRTLETIVRLNGKREAAFACASLENTQLTVQ
jgi:hypothetical protein